MTSTAPVGRPGRAAPMPPEDRRRAIVAAVVPLLLEGGPDVSTRRMAEAAGIAEGTIFRVFPDKTALLVAAARATVDPQEGRAQLTAALAGVTDLRERVVVTAEHLHRRSERVTAVLLAARRAHVNAPDHDGRRAGPPPWLAEASRALHETLTEVLEPHRAELAVEPARAALLLCALVFGSRHPGLQHDEEPGDRLTAAEIADVLLDGLRRPDTPEGDR